MTAKEIIMAMVEGLQNPITEIDMFTFGNYNNNKKICYGCAATNTILKICNINSENLHKNLQKQICKPYNDSIIRYDDSIIRYRTSLYNLLKINNSDNKLYVKYFEVAINYLRQGLLTDYNHIARHINMSEIEPNLKIKLPKLEDNYTQKDLDKYIELAKQKKGKLDICVE